MVKIMLELVVWEKRPGISKHNAGAALTDEYETWYNQPQNKYIYIHELKHKYSI
jgi:hypothetical protein